MKYLKIAQVSPLFESVPPKLYGGTERVVGYLTDGLVELGHEVTLFATGDSDTRANLVKIVPKALRLENCLDAYAHHTVQLQKVIEMADNFDVIHFHTDYFHFPVSRIMNYNHITTLHGRLNIPDLFELYRIFTDIPLVSISYNQRKPLPKVNWFGNVYHGLPENLYTPGNGAGGFALFLGRISPEKRLDRAIEISRKAGIPLKVAAKVDNADKEYFEREISHLLDQPHVDFIGEIGEREKNELLGNAKVMLFPIDWPEPFGMVLIESLACGTPIVAYGMGSVPELLEQGKTGYIVNSVDDAVTAVKNIDKIKREDCVRTFRERFTSTRMAKDYLTLFRKLIELNKRFKISENGKKPSEEIELSS